MVVSNDSQRIGSKFKKAQAEAERFFGDIVFKTAVKNVMGPAKEEVYLGDAGDVNHLHRVTGTLGKSIITVLNVEPGVVTASTGSSVEYARIHELGGVIVGKYGQTIVIPPRPYLTPPFRENKDKIKADIDTGIVDFNKRTVSS